MKYLTLSARLLIGGLFIYASVHKIFDPLDFAASIRNYNILPASWSNMTAVILPWIELGVGVFSCNWFSDKAVGFDHYCDAGNFSRRFNIRVPHRTGYRLRVF